MRPRLSSPFQIGEKCFDNYCVNITDSLILNLLDI